MKLVVGLFGNSYDTIVAYANYTYENGDFKELRRLSISGAYRINILRAAVFLL